MSILISGICGFVGSTLARCLRESDSAVEIFGFDNFSRPGSYLNKALLEQLNVKVFFADARQQSDIEQLPAADWVIDASANPSVLAGLDGKSSTRQVIENNLYSTVNLLEYAARNNAGFILLSSSRVYSIDALLQVPLVAKDGAFVFDQQNLTGISQLGLDERFSTAAPISLYGSTKLSSEIIACEYADKYKFPLWINRCGVLAGQGQFGRSDQGIFAYWIHSYLAKKPLRYIGFNGSGNQVRDCLHPSDLASLIQLQMKDIGASKPIIYNVGGGIKNSISLKQLSDWCAERFGFDHQIEPITTPRQLDVPWIVMDSSLAQKHCDFKISMPLNKILAEIADHAEHNPDWLSLSNN